MVVMLRSLGIPARVVAGYLPGNWDPDLQVNVVRESDSHSWPEVYFPQYGWVEFEPTASTPAGGAPADRGRGSGAECGYERRYSGNPGPAPTLEDPADTFVDAKRSRSDDRGSWWLQVPTHPVGDRIRASRRATGSVWSWPDWPAVVEPALPRPAAGGGGLREDERGGLGWSDVADGLTRRRTSTRSRWRGRCRPWRRPFTR